MGDSHSAGLGGVFEVMMAASNMNKNPAIRFEFGNDVSTVHALIVHIIHTLSIFGGISPTVCASMGQFRINSPRTARNHPPVFLAGWAGAAD